MSDKAEPVKVYARTVVDPQAEHEAKRQGHRQRDVLERLRDRTRPTAFKPNVSVSQYSSLEDDLRDAADEIEWLRASRPADSVPRGELDAMAEQLREMKAILAGILARIEQGK